MNFSQIFQKGKYQDDVAVENLTDRNLQTKSYATSALLNYLISTGKVNSFDENEITLLMRLCENDSDLSSALKLIKIGTNVNVQDKKGLTALYYATASRNAAVVKALLDKGAKTFGVDCGLLKKEEGYLDERELLIILMEILNRPLTDLSVTVTSITHNLLLFKNTPDSYFEIECHFLPLCYERNAELFRFLFIHSSRILLDEKKLPSLLHIYLPFCNFANEDWIDCLKLLLKSEIAPKLMEDFRRVSKRRRKNNCDYYSLTHLFVKKCVPENDRMELLQLWFSLGAKITMFAIQKMFYVMGYGKEATFLIYNIDPEQMNCYRSEDLVINIICGNICKFDYKQLFSEYTVHFKNSEPSLPNTSETYMRKHLLTSFVFKTFTVPFLLKKELNEAGTWNIPVERLKLSPQFIPLQELCRNIFRNYLKEYYKPTCPGDFFRLIDNLNVPDTLKKYLKLKTCSLDRCANTCEIASGPIVQNNKTYCKMVL